MTAGSLVAAVPPLESLEKLYPGYEREGLAGLSGDEAAASTLLRNGNPLNSNVSSWVYFPGYRFNPTAAESLAIIWERQGGLSVVGRRKKVHAVGFDTGGASEIPDDQWGTFLTNQAALRQKIITSQKIQIRQTRLQTKRPIVETLDLTFDIATCKILNYNNL